MYIAVKRSSVENYVKENINILQMASKTASNHQKQFHQWAGKLQFCLTFVQN